MVDEKEKATTGMASDLTISDRDGGWLPGCLMVSLSSSDSGVFVKRWWILVGCKLYIIQSDDHFYSFRQLPSMTEKI